MLLLRPWSAAAPLSPHTDELEAVVVVAVVREQVLQERDDLDRLVLIRMRQVDVAQVQDQTLRVLAVKTPIDGWIDIQMYSAQRRTLLDGLLGPKAVTEVALVV